MKNNTIPWVFLGVLIVFMFIITYQLGYKMGTQDSRIKLLSSDKIDDSSILRCYMVLEETK